MREDVDVYVHVYMYMSIYIVCKRLDPLVPLLRHYCQLLFVCEAAYASLPRENLHPLPPLLFPTTTPNPIAIPDSDALTDARTTAYSKRTHSYRCANYGRSHCVELEAG